MNFSWCPGTHTKYPGIGYQVNTRVSGTRVWVVQSLNRTSLEIIKEIVKITGLFQTWLSNFLLFWSLKNLFKRKKLKQNKNFQSMLVVECWQYLCKTVKCWLNNKTCYNNRNTHQFKYISNWLGMKTSQNELKKLMDVEWNCWNDNSAWALKKNLLV